MAKQSEISEKEEIKHHESPEKVKSQPTWSLIDGKDPYYHITALIKKRGYGDPDSRSQLFTFYDRIRLIDYK